MANPSLFRSRRGGKPPEADAVNEAGGLAYTLPPKHALAQIAATGCLGNTFYASAETQLSTVQRIVQDGIAAGDVTPEYLGKLAVYAGERAYMKDMPALLLCVLRQHGGEAGKRILSRAWPRVVTTGRILRNVVQMVRSGRFGSKNVNGVMRRLVQRWLTERKPHALFRDSVGNDPSLADIIKLARPKCGESERAALLGYLIGKVGADDPRLPVFVREWESFKREPEGRPTPDAPMQMLTSLKLTKQHWAEIAERGRWHQTRMNLQNYARHGVFEDAELRATIAGKLRDPEAIAKAKVFPYQLLVAYLATTGGLRSQRGRGGDVPLEITNALQDAMELAIDNVPSLDGRVRVFVDQSYSMSSPVTGSRGRGSDSVVRCIDTAALYASAILRKNPEARVLGFDTGVRDARLNPRDSVVSNAEKLATCGGGTNCAAPLAKLNAERDHADVLIYLSDSESWFDSMRGYYGVHSDRATGTEAEWEAFKSRNPNAKLVCIDMAPHETVQTKDRPGVLNVGGFSDAVFEIVRAFTKGELSPEHWVGAIENIEL